MNQDAFVTAPKNDINETTKLTSSEEEPTYAKLGGEHQSLDMNAGNEEYITFDFMVTLSSNILSSNNNLQLAIKQSVDCELDQIKDLSMKEIDGGSGRQQSRVSGKIYTDDWELPILQKKFQSIISDRVLSGNLQSICELDDRPTIRRFYCKTSKQLTQNNDNKSDRNALINAHKTPSFRTARDDNTTTNANAIPKAKAKAKVNESVSMEEQKDVDNRSDSPKDTSPLKEKGNKERKYSGEGGHNTSPEKDNDHCDCLCVIL